MNGVRLFISCLCLVAVWAESEPNAYAPELDLKDYDGKKTDVYRGFLLSDERDVSLVPELKATDKDEIGGARFICGYRIYADYAVPFEVVVNSHVDGNAKLRVKDGVNLSDYLRNKYKFEIAAFDCGNPTLHSKKAHVVIRVLPAPEKSAPPLPDNIESVAQSTPPLPDDVKSLIDGQIDVVDTLTGEKKPLDLQTPSPPSSTAAPSTESGSTVAYPRLPLPDQGGEAFFDRPSYIVAMRESTLYDSILKLRPSRDHTTENICGYEILTRDVPFTVDESGNIKNTKALSYDVQKSYILSVVAKHCDGLVSKPAIINVQVSQICSNGWKDLPTNSEYKAGTRAITPFSEAWLDTCETSCEDTETVSVTVSLQSDGQINSCNHTTYSIQSQRDSCGAAKNTIELLPQGQPWTENLQSVEGHEAAYKFDGKTAVKVPSTRSNHTLGNYFTLALWMQHGEEKKDGHKEHIMCNADGDSMNRHHYSLFVHNCRLVFLLRKEADQVTSLDKFMPAEWRWSIPHVCDGNWHHYAVSVDYPTVRLFVDGQRIQDDSDVLEVVDDWALHPTNKVHFTQLTVGACWQGETSDFGQYFDGALADVTMVTGSTETERVIKCLNSCGEKLQFHAMDLLEVGMSVSFNTELTEITISGDDSTEVKKLLRHVGYTNTNGDPRPGYRTLHLSTNMTCDGKGLSIQEQAIPILVSAVSDPEITIGGVMSKLRSPNEFARGVDVFTEIMILSAPEKQLVDEENRINKLDFEDINMLQKDLKNKLLLDKCEVRVDTKMNPDVERLRLPSDLLVKYLLDSKEFDHGFDITGSETYSHYEQVIRETFYLNSEVDLKFPGRKFTVQCSDMNGKFVSNAFTIEVGVEDIVQQAEILYADASFDHAAISNGLEMEENDAFVAANSATTGSGAVVAVVVVCVVLLIGVIIFAIIKIRSVQSGTQRNPNVNIEDGPEMEWDNSTLNITVNPLETDELIEQLKVSQMEMDSEEEMMPSEDEDELTNKDGLEWDNSTY